MSLTRKFTLQESYKKEATFREIFFHNDHGKSISQDVALLKLLVHDVETYQNNILISRLWYQVN